MVLVEAIISAYAALVVAALDDDEPDEARRLLSLLESLGSEPAWPQRTLTIDWLILPSGPVTTTPTGRHPSLMASLT